MTAPLRKIVETMSTNVYDEYVEILECGHEHCVTSQQAGLAKRRRCHVCAETKRLREAIERENSK